jgi:hypothetical protein
MAYTFAELAAQPYGAKAIGVVMSFYNYGTNTSWAFYVSGNPIFAPTYSPILESCSGLSSELSFLSPLASIADFTFTLLNNTVHNSPAGQTKLSDQFAAGYFWYGKEITVRLLAYDEGAKAIRHYNLWTGLLTECDYDDTTITFTAVATANWKLGQLYPADVIDLVAYPQAADGVVGMPKPRVFGDCKAIVADAGFSDAYNALSEVLGLADMHRIIPAYCWDRHLDDTAGPEYACASAAIKEFGSAASHDVFSTHTGQTELAYACSTDYDADQGYTITNDGSGARVTLKKRFGFYTCTTPTTASAANTVDNPERAIDKDLATYCSTASAKTLLDVECDRPATVGRLVCATAVVIYEAAMSQAGGEQLEIGLYDTGGAAWIDGNTVIAADTAGVTIATHDVDTILYPEDLPDTFTLRVNHANRNASSVVKIYEIGIIIQWRWAASVGSATSERTDTATRRASLWQPRIAPRAESANPDISTIYVGCKGQADTGAGTYTGTPDAVIETPVSIAAYLAVLSGCSLVTSGHGLLATARTDQNTDTLKARLAIAKKQPYQELLADLCQHSVAGAFVQSASAMKIGFVYWGSAASDNLYATPINGADIFEFSAGWTALSEVRNAVYVHCEYDYRLGKCTKLVYCDGAGSDDGTGSADYAECAKLAASESYYGRRELTLQAYTLTQTAAIAVRNQLADMLYQPRVWLRLKLPWKYYTLEAGHVIELDDASCQAIGFKYPGQTDSTDGAWAHGAETRYFWVERVTISEDCYIEIEATEGVW